jgi:hypothetical protein
MKSNKEIKENLSTEDSIKEIFEKFEKICKVETIKNGKRMFAGISCSSINWKELKSEILQKIKELEKWQERGRLLEEKIISYNWEYRKKICMNCNKEKRKKLNCMAFSSFKDGLQETHCRNLIIARTKKFKKETMNIIDSHPLTQIINDNYKG